MKCSNLIISAALLAFLPATSNAETHVPAGPISGTWTSSGSPYYIEGNVYITSTSSLTIQPGVDVLFLPACRFRIEGQLLAMGTQADSILFTATDTTQGSESLDFLNTNSSPRDSSKLVYCIISYGLASPSPDPYMHGGGIYVKNSSRLKVAHCTITRCRTRDVWGATGQPGQPGSPMGGPGESVHAGHGGGIFCDQSSPLITENTISYNYSGRGTGGMGGTGADVTNYFETAYGGAGGIGGPGYGGDGGGIYLIESNAVIYGNTFKGNRAGKGYGGFGGIGGNAYGYEGDAYGGDGGTGGAGYGGKGGAIYSINSSSFISNNLIINNSSGDAVGGQGGMEGHGNGSGGSDGHGGNGYGGLGYALYAEDNSIDSVNNLTVALQYPLAIGQGGTGDPPDGLPGMGFNGTHVIFGDNLVCHNLIIWDNSAPEITTNTTISYSCVQGGHAGIGNISLNPLFVAPSINDFCLIQYSTGHPQQSPCVNSGDQSSSMITGTTRTDGVQDSGIVDMGYHYPVNSQQSQVVLNLTPHNPPIQIPPGGGSFQFDIQITTNNLFHSSVDIWTVIQMPDGNPYPILMRQNIQIPPGSSIIRTLTQFIPGSAQSGSYSYWGYIRDHLTWAELAQDSFAFEKLSGSGAPAHELGWALFGWDDDIPTVDDAPTTFTILGNSPNPFNPTTTIRFYLSQLSPVIIDVFNVCGQKAWSQDLGYLPAGMQKASFDGTAMPSGVYLFHLQAGLDHGYGKIVLLK